MPGALSNMTGHPSRSLVNEGEAMSNADAPEEEASCSNWHAVDQPTIDQFAAVTGDDQFIHLDQQRATQSVFGTTIAHGFLALSLVPTLFKEAIVGPESRAVTINYGIDRLRFTAPIPSGARIRARFKLLSRIARSANETLLKYSVIVELENQEKPAMVADWLIVRRQAPSPI
jgi:acyl dehydratase